MMKTLALILSILSAIGLFGTAFAQSPGKIVISVSDDPITAADGILSIKAQLVNSDVETVPGPMGVYVQNFTGEMVEFTLKYPYGEDPTWEIKQTTPAIWDGRAWMDVPWYDPANPFPEGTYSVTVSTPNNLQYESVTENFEMFTAKNILTGTQATSPEAGNEYIIFNKTTDGGGRPDNE
jgi:hypothetical protein